MWNVHSSSRYHFPGIGQIYPEGFLKEFLERQHEGLSGHYQRMHYPFDSCLWAGEIERSDGPLWWAYEQTAYLLDGLFRLSCLIHAPELQELCSANLRYVLDHVDSSGQLARTPCAESEWPMAVFFRMALAWVEATGSAEVIEAFHRHYQAIPLETLAKVGRNPVNIEGVLHVYGWTGDRSLLEKAEKAWELFNFQAVRSENREVLTESDLCSGKKLNLHGVTFCEMVKIPVLLFLFSGKQHYLDAAENGLHQAMIDHEQAVGIFSCNEHLSGRDPYQGFEICCISDLLWSLSYFLQATGKVEYADRMEKIAFNALPGAVTKDFTGTQYISLVNQFTATPYSNHTHSLLGAMDHQAYAPEHEPQCCPGNVNRAMPNYVLRMWMTDSAGAPVAALYGPSRFSCKQFEIQEITRYPFEDRIDFLFRIPSGSVNTKFSFRIPTWCSRAQILLNGETQKGICGSGSFASIQRTWLDGDCLTLFLPAELRMQGEREWRWLERGPIVFSFPIPEQDSAERSDRFSGHSFLPAGAWNYALDPHREPSEYSSLRYLKSPDPLLSPAMELEVSVETISGWDDLSYGRFTPECPLFFHKTGRCRIRLIPYANTLLRLTAFPVAAKRSSLPVTNIWVSPKFPYSWKLPLRDQEFAPRYFSHARLTALPRVQMGPDLYCDLVAHFKCYEQHLAYLYGVFFSPRNGLAVFSIGVASGIQCWIDGEEVFYNEGPNEARAMAPLRFEYPVRKGENRILMKVASGNRCFQYFSDWGVRLQFFFEE